MPMFCVGDTVSVRNGDTVTGEIVRFKDGWAIIRDKNGFEHRKWTGKLKLKKERVKP